MVALGVQGSLYPLGFITSSDILSISVYLSVTTQSRALEVMVRGGYLRLITRKGALAYSEGTSQLVKQTPAPKTIKADVLPQYSLVTSGPVEVATVSPSPKQLTVPAVSHLVKVISQERTRRVPSTLKIKSTSTKQNPAVVRPYP